LLPASLDQFVLANGNAMNLLTLFGLIAVALMLVFYALERRSRWYTLAFAGACALGSVYGFLQGAWPFGLVEVAWSIVAVRRWWLAGKSVA
jgi:phosphatidylglycerophosphate synthase